MARDRKRAKARRDRREAAEARRDARRARGADPLAPEQRSTTVAPDPVAEISGPAELAKEAAEGDAPEAIEEHPLDARDFPHADELTESELDEATESEPTRADLARAQRGPLTRGRRRRQASGLEPDEEDVDAELATAATGDLHEAAELEQRPRRARAPGTREGPRVAIFLRHCWDELQRVQWPDRRQVAQATGVVIAFVIIAGSYLGLADALMSRLVNLVI